MEMDVLLGEAEERHTVLLACGADLIARMEQEGVDDGAIEPLRALQRLLVDHVRREQDDVFPGIRAVARGDRGAVAALRTGLEAMASDHEAVVDGLARARASVGSAGELGAELGRFLDALSRHDQVEDEVLLPRVHATVAALDEA